MLPKKYSLSKKKDIQQVFQKGQIYFSSFFNVKFMPNQLKHSRFCFIVSTKISKKAVDRNKLKRRLKAIVYKNLSNFSQNYDIIILTKPAALTINFKQLEKNLLFLFKKAHLV